MSERYTFWVNEFKYVGEIVAETSTHWIIQDRFKGRILLPKGNTIREELK